MTTPVLAVNGINVGSIMALGTLPAEPRRDIGEVAAGSDGTLVPTRLSTKRDITFTTKQLSGADANVWEQLLKGDSEVFPFNTTFGLYTSKGLAAIATSPGDTSIQTTVKKYTAAVTTAAGESFETSGLYFPPATQAAWVRIGTDPFHHYARTSGGKVWVDGVRNDAALHPFDVDVGAGPFGDEAILGPNAVGVGTPYAEDWIISPFTWPDDWPAQVAAAVRNFGPCPKLDVAGSIVREKTARVMLATVSGSSVLKGNLGDGAGQQSDLRVLAVTLQEV